MIQVTGRRDLHLGRAAAADHRGGAARRRAALGDPRLVSATTEAVVPRELIYPPDQTEQQVEQQNAEDFKASQTSAETVALRELGYPGAGRGQGRHRRTARRSACSSRRRHHHRRRHSR